MLLYPLGSSDSLRYAVTKLRLCGVPIIDHPSPDVTHVLLDVPYRPIDDLDQVLQSLPDHVILISGRLPERFLTRPHIDLLQDEGYLWKNAALTAVCALRCVPPIPKDSNVLVIGWGRIGKHLIRLLSSLNVHTTLLSHSAIHRVEAQSFGIQTGLLSNYHTVFNTAPYPIQLPEAARNAVKVDLASVDGLSGDDVIHARGLPNLLAPESSGQLIAETILNNIKEVRL